MTLYTSLYLKRNICQKDPKAVFLTNPILNTTFFYIANEVQTFPNSALKGFIQKAKRKAQQHVSTAG